MRLSEKFEYLDINKKAILAVNFYNFETLKGILAAAKQCNQQIILQLTESSLDYMGLENAFAMGRSALQYYGVTGWIHLDHGSSVDIAKKCLDAGFDSVMYDGSELQFEQNVENTCKIVQYAKKFNANVEAELGYVAKLGQPKEKKVYTNPDDAKLFVEETGIHALAVAIGTAHGFYKEKPKLQFDILKEISQKANAHLVLHGGSGVPDEDISRSIQLGIRKINLATEVKNIFMKTLQDTLKDNAEIDLRKVFPVATDAITRLVSKKLKLVSCE